MPQPTRHTLSSATAVSEILYIFYKIFFLLHFLVFEIRTNYLIRWIFLIPSSFLLSPPFLPMRRRRPSHERPHVQRLSRTACCCSPPLLLLRAAAAFLLLRLRCC